MTTSLIISDLCFSYDTMSRPLFDRLNLTFPPGWTALSGLNGCGKSTLISLISGSLAPLSGRIEGNGTVAVCDQDMETLPSFFEDPSVMNDPYSIALLARLGVDESAPWRWESLSGGERRRCVIAGALIRRPDVLLLDEPTNHIDADALSLLAAELARFPGIGIIVSHNLSFLERLCSHTVSLWRDSNGTKAVSRDCPPETAFREESREVARLRAAWEAETKKLRTLEGRFKSAGETVARGRNKLSKRNLDPKDHSSRAEINLARLSGKDAVAGAAQARIAGQMQRLREKIGRGNAPGLRKTGTSISGARSSRDWLYRRSAGSMPIASGAITLIHPELVILPGTRVAVVGPNGAGKTSLVEAIVAALEIAPDEIFTLRQELSAAERRAALGRFRSCDDNDKARVLSYVYRLGSEPESILSAECASPGETRKLLFALATLDTPSCLALDEPTNHLDDLSVRALAEALGEFKGAIILVTHDNLFADKLGCIRWNIRRNGDCATLAIGGT